MSDTTHPAPTAPGTDNPVTTDPDGSPVEPDGVPVENPSGSVAGSGGSGASGESDDDADTASGGAPEEPE